MDSSTSHSEVFPRRAATLLLVALGVWVACAFYSLRLNPEVAHCVQGAAIKKIWAEKLTGDYGQKFVVFGGSSCEFSIDGERMLKQHQLPLVNYGGHAGMGACVLTESVLEHVNPGDTLIIAIEPGLLTGPLNQSSLGVQFSVAMHRPNWVTDPTLGVGRINEFQVATLLRPGGYNAFTMLGKVVRRQPLYRYKLSDYHASGWKQTAVRLPVTGPAGHGIRLSDDSLALLRGLRKWCDEHQVRSAYSLPWSYCPTDKAREFQKQNAEFLLQMAQIFPVLKDPSLGADPIIEHYADTGLHLNETGVPLRTDELAGQIKGWQVWTVEELQTLAATP